MKTNFVLTLALAPFLAVNTFAGTGQIGSSGSATPQSEHCFYNGATGELLRFNSKLEPLSVIEVSDGQETRLVKMTSSKKDMREAEEFLVMKKQYPNRLFARTDLQKIKQYSISTARELEYCRDSFPNLQDEERPCFSQKVIILQTMGDQRFHVLATEISNDDSVNRAFTSSQLQEAECSLKRVNIPENRVVLKQNNPFEG